MFLPHSVRRGESRTFALASCRMWCGTESEWKSSSWGLGVAAPSLWKVQCSEMRLYVCYFQMFFENTERWNIYSVLKLPCGPLLPIQVFHCNASCHESQQCCWIQSPDHSFYFIISSTDIEFRYMQMTNLSKTTSFSIDTIVGPTE